MKIVFDCQMPSLLAHGGGQIQAINTIKALREIGVDADFVRWWDPEQEADVLHFFGRINGFYTSFAKAKGIKFVLADLLTSQGSRTGWQHFPHWCLRQFDKLTLGKVIASNFGWTSYRMADAVLALTPWEAELMPVMFGADSGKVHVVPNGVEEVFFLKPEYGKSQPEREDYLVSTATITERKRVLELAEAAVVAKTPVWIVGKPYSETDPYYQRFLAVHRANPQIIRYEGPVADREQMAEIYQKARGFVLLSTMESLSLSALEAAASECPLLLSDLPWARCTFGEKASYCAITRDVQKTASILKKFHTNAPSLPHPERPKTWIEVAQQLKIIYENIS